MKNSIIRLLMLLTLVTLFLPLQPLVQAATLGNITGFSANGTTFNITCGSDQVKVIFYKHDLFRIWVGPGGTFTSPSPDEMVVSYSFPAISVTWADMSTYYKLESDECVLRAYKTPLKFALYKKDNTTVVWEEDTGIQLGTTTYQKLKTGANEYFYGCGLQTGYYSHKGRSVKIENTTNWEEGGQPHPVPFYMSTAGYGAFRNTWTKGLYDFLSVLSASHNENRFDCFYCYGPSLDKILDRYTELTGRPSLIPRWGMGMGDSNCYNPTSGCYAIADGYRNNDMPGSWILPDDGYGCGYTNLPQVVTDLWTRGFRTGLWTSSGVNPSSEVGTAGIRLYKLDVAWVGSGYASAFNASKTSYTGIENNCNDRGYVFSVCGWAGTQRYSATWNGDNTGSWDYNRFQIPGYIGAGLSGIAYASGDVDGIFGGSAKTYVRDLQWKCFLPFFYVMSGWATYDKQPWIYGEPYTTYNRAALKLRQRLIPYLYTYLAKSYQTGAPLVRAMAYQFPDDDWAKTDAVKYQFMCGDWFLVAPVYTDTTVKDNIYLTPGKWIDYWTGTEYIGPYTIQNYSAPLDRLPLLVKAGAIIPMYPSSLYDGQVAPDPVTFDIYPQGNSSFTLYEDDGASRAHRTGSYANTVINVTIPAQGTTGDLVVQVGASNGSYTGKPSARKNEFTIHSKHLPASVLLNSSALTQYATKAEYDAAASGWYYDVAEKGGMIYAKTASLSTGSGFELKVTGFIADVDPTPAPTVSPTPTPSPDPRIVPQSQMTATATSYQSGDDPPNAIDGKPSSMWHTKWDGSDKLPQSITLNLGGTYPVYQLKYLPRQDVGTNGIITSYKVYLSTNGSTFTQITSGTWANDKTEKSATFTATNAAYVKLEAIVGNGGFASAAEINIYRNVGPTSTPGPTATPTPTPTPTSTPLPTLFSDGFESNNFTTGGWTNSGCTLGSTYKYAGTYAVVFNSSDSLTKAKSTAGYSVIQVKYARYTRNCETDDHFIAEWYNGSAWTMMEDLTGNSGWTVMTWNLPAGAGNNANFQIRFRTSHNGSSDYAYLDEVLILGTQL
jgi:alpha-glucosidase (family GH31 glycosyl hydrolase)